LFCERTGARTFLSDIPVRSSVGR